MNKDIRWKQRFQNYAKALQQLREAVAKTKLDRLQEQGMIQCFEYTCELAWKTLQDFLAEARGYTDVRGPRPVLEQAFADGIIAAGTQWLAMLKDRNQTSHLDDAKAVQQVLGRIRTTYFPLFTSLEVMFKEQS
jgi:nucleotidyltransferase substrate binding protein (TIGR01987 family)